jgi:hypothetical protein
MIARPTSVVAAAGTTIRSAPRIGISFNHLEKCFRAVLRAGGCAAPAPATPEHFPASLEESKDALVRPAGQGPWTRLRENDAAAIDPLELSLAGPPGIVVAGTSAPAAAADVAAPVPSATNAEAALVEQVVRRIVWGGDRRRGVARIDLGGEHTGTSIWVSGGDRELEIEFVLGQGVGGNELAERLVARLESRGIAVVRCDVR